MLSSRGQSLRASFAYGRSVVGAEERTRVRLGLAHLSPPELALNLAKALAQSGITSAVYSLDLTEVASAGPRSPSGVETGVSVPQPNHSNLVAAGQYDTVIGPSLYGSGSASTVVMLLPLDGRLGTHLGLIELVEPGGPVRTVLTSAAHVLTLGSAAVLLIALLVGLVLTTRGLGPLRRLTAAAQAVGRGDLSRRSGLPPRHDEVGELARVFDEMADSVERTVTERESTARRMRQFIGDASHELRTPLTAIKGYLDVLQRGGGASPQVVRDALPVMSREAERMRLLVMDLLTLARADEGRALDLRPVDLAAFLQRFLESRAQATAVTLQLQPGAVALADPDTLATIAGNLQANAERHGGGREIVWSTVRKRGLVGFRCADRGPGIESPDLPHVFERFFRAGDARSRQDGGSGLGLAIVKSLAEAQGGEVEVASEPGQGAQFTVLLRPTGAAGWVPAPPAS